MDDTIVAISTALGIGAISIIRVSGRDSLKIVNKIFKGNNLEKVKSHTIHYGHIIDDRKIVDEVLVSVMLTPKTFTKENIVEINGHGGIISSNMILELLLKNGCRLAEPGEFTKRAFLNGRIDLIEAESVMDLIMSKTEQAHEMSINQLRGKVSNLIRVFREQILEIILNIEVNIDYPEYEDIEEVTINNLKKKLPTIKKEIIKILKESKNGKIIKEGIKVIIIGKPNVGKSSLLNKLIEEDKAIVTSIPGTTRDVVEGTLNLNGLLLNLIDTAGIRKTDDLIEEMGVKRTLEQIKFADLILLVLDNSKLLSSDDFKILEEIKEKNHLIVINKIDLPKKINDESLDKKKLIYISTLKNKGFEELEEKIKNIFDFEKIITKDLTYLTSARSIYLLKDVLKKIEDIEQSVDNNEYIDMIEIDLKKVWEQLGQITGETYQEELTEKLFEQFCLGK